MHNVHGIPFQCMLVYKKENKTGIFTEFDTYLHLFDLQNIMYLTVPKAESIGSKPRRNTG